MHRPTGPGPFTFELAWQPTEGARFLPGLVTIDAQTHVYDGDRSGSETARSGSGRPPVGPVSGPSRGGEDTLFPLETQGEPALNGGEAPKSGRVPWGGVVGLCDSPVV